MSVFFPDPPEGVWPIDHVAMRGRDEAIALVSKAGSLTFGEMEVRVGGLAGWLLEQGLSPGDRLASWLAKGQLACLLPLAAARAGLVYVPLNPLLKRAQVEHILSDSGARLLVGESSRLATLDREGAAACRLVAADDVGNGKAIPLSAQNPDSLAQLLYTSGSTGLPKGVMLSHRNLWLGAVSVAQYLHLTPDDRTLAVLPLSFDYGQNQLLSAWFAGGSVIPLDYLLPRDVLRAVERHEVTTLAGVPPLWLQLVDLDWSSAGTALRRLTNSGGALGEPLVRRLRTALPGAKLFAMYGLTEAFRSTYLDPALIDAHPSSIGRAIPWAEVLVIGADGQVANSGELVHCGPLVAQGYWNDATRTAERFRPAPSASRCGGMAVWSGDQVHRDDEGLLYFDGRSDGLIKVSGNRVSAEEIEQAALASGLVSEAVAVGRADEKTGQAVILFAVAKAAADDGPLRAAMSVALPSFMQPARIVWRETLPRNPNGKFDRALLAAEAARS